MAVFKIRIDKPRKKAPHYRIVRAPSIQSAEYYALQHMLLPSGQATMEDHFKMGYTPFINSINRSEHKSVFEFQSDMIELNSPVSRVRIIRDNESKPSVHYNIEHDESIFDLLSDDDDRKSGEMVASLPFFTRNDLEYFSGAIGRQFSRGDEASIEIKSILTERGVYAKTHFWATLLKNKGYNTEFRYDWQHSGRVRTYTWARIFLPQLKTPYVFFTVGVGSRFTEEDKVVSTLEYKLDCRRDKLSPEKIKLFDDYVEKFCPLSRRQKIESNELSTLTWDILADRTVAFIQEYTEDYEQLTELIDDESNLPRRSARLCWNERGWEEPSGPIGKSKTSAKSFEKEKGYGHEEWFFDTEKQIEGYHYAFLQAFNKGDHEGETYEMHLYAIKDTGRTKDKYWVGRIKKLEVLTKEEAQETVAIYKKRGWFNERLKQLSQFQIQHFNFDIVAENEMFNVRYKVDNTNFIRYNPYRLIKNFEREVGSNHYVLLEKKPGEIDSIVSGLFQFSEGHNPETKKGIITSNYSSPSYSKTLLHEEMKERIYCQLKKQYEGTGIKIGSENPTGHGTSVDIVVNDPQNGLTFYEIKTGGSALSCIREALGQIIEYSFYPTNQNASTLIIVSPHPVDVSIKLYMKHLRKVMRIEIYYQQYLLATKSLEISLT